MGLEEHLLGMFSEDFEFHNDARPSHLGGGATERQRTDPATAGREASLAAAGDEERDAADGAPRWSEDAEQTLSRIPFFVRGKARRNTETYARERGIATITSETLYDAKAHFGR
jgi:light-independent protochlorophyllide reductase subunit B